jgi:hypothetical protein
MGLAHPDTPNRNQAKNLELPSVSPSRTQLHMVCVTYFNPVGIFQMDMQSVEKSEQIDMIVYIIQDGYIDASVVPNHEDTIVIDEMTVGI